MQTIQDSSWQRRGFTLLWEPSLLADLVNPAEIVTFREFIKISNQWPESLPSGKGNSLIVSGLDGCLDILTPDDAETWLERDVKAKILDFQSEYEGLAALMFWVPGGRKRFLMEPATESYLWRCAPPNQQKEIQVGRLLWGGSESDVMRVMNPKEKNQDPDGAGWVGLHHPRIT